MKNVVFAHLLVFLPTILNAQNIGIGDPAPSAKLTVRGGESTADGQAAAIKLQNTTSTNSWFLRAGGLGTNTPGNGFSIGDNTGYHLVISQGGNTGIGINPATAKLHVNGAMKLEGTSLLEFGAGIAGKELNAGKIGYNGFGTNALAIVGAGTNTTNRAVYFFAEGGTTFSGPINLFGTFKVFGNQGSPGQVLTSNGSSAPTWENTAFSNSTRFGVDYHTSLLGSEFMSVTARYNLNPADVSVGANSITINKSGLYRFNGNVNGRVGYFSGTPAFEPEMDCYFELSGAVSQLIHITAYDRFVKRTSTSISEYNMVRWFSFDMYIEAGTIIRTWKNFQFDTAGSGSGTASVILYGNLISE